MAYIWKTKVQNSFKDCNTTVVFPAVINLFLNRCTPSDMKQLLDREHFLRINLCDDCIEACLLTIAGCNSEQYQSMLDSCPQNMVPCEIRLGPFWHLLWMDRTMCVFKNMEREGTVLVGRDAFSNESEEKIKQVEQEDGIFIVRKQNTAQ